MVEVDPARLRELAKTVRTVGDEVAELAPLAKGAKPNATMKGSSFALNVENVGLALDRVLAFHGDALRSFATKAETAANEYEATDKGTEAKLEQVVPR